MRKSICPIIYEVEKEWENMALALGQEKPIFPKNTYIIPSLKNIHEIENN